MMKRILAVLLLAAGPAWGACPTTTNLGLDQCPFGTSLWNNNVNAAFGILDDAVLHTGTKLTSGRVPYATTGGEVKDEAGFEYTEGSNLLTVGVLALTTPLDETDGGTGTDTFTLGDLLYSSASNTLAKLAGNTTTTKKILTQTGNGSVSAAPTWGTLVAGDLPSAYIDALGDFAAGLCGTNEILEDQGGSWACIATPSGGGSGDAVEIEDGDNAGTFTAIDTTARFDDSGDIGFAFSDGGAGGPDVVTATVRAAKITAAMLKSVDSAADEECLTRETTTGDFEWQACGGAPAGSNGEVQFNNAGSFGADADFTYSSGSNHLEIFGESQITVDPVASTDRGFITLQHGGTSGTGGGRVRWLTGWGVNWSMGTKNSDAKLYIGMDIVDPTSDPRIIFGTGSVGPVEIPDGIYLQASDNNAGAPASGDCDADAERGRFSIDTTNDRLYVCNGATRGWDYVALTN